MFIQRILTTAVLAELLLFLMVANCAPSRPREDAGRVPGNPSSSYLPSVVSGSSNIIKNGHKRKAVLSSAIAAGDPLDASTLKHHPPNEIVPFRRVYRWSTGCSSVRPDGGLLRFLLKGVDARGDSTDPDTDIELSSVNSDGKVYIISKSRKHYLCFNKKGQLVTKKRLGGDKTLCQFYETLWRGNRRFVSVYRRHQQHQQHQEPIVMWSAPIPGSWKEAPIAPAFQLDTQDHPQDWHVGFDLSGKPLKGSAWRNPVYQSCFDLVEHVDHVHPPGVRPWPIADNQMSMIFQSENNVPDRSQTNSRKVVANDSPSLNKKRKNSARSKSNGGENVKSVAKNSLGRPSSANHKNVETSSHNWKSSSGNNKRNNKINHSSGSRNRQGVFSEEQSRAPKSKSDKAKTNKGTTETELMAPIEFWKTNDEKYNKDHEVAMGPVSANVDFDSYLAETEQLLAHPEQVVGHSEDSSAPTSSTAQRSAFIHLDTGGWEEVVYSKSTPETAILHQKDDSGIIIDDQLKWRDNAEEEIN